MRTLWNYSNYGNDIKLTRSDAELCSQVGDCTPFVEAVMLKPYVKKQLKAISVAQLKKELSEYGAWNDEELNDHSKNLMRWVWISAGDIMDCIYSK